MLPAHAQKSDARPPIVLADFEGADYGKWTTTGTAFGAAPAQGTLRGQMTVEGFQGHGLADSYLGDDDAVGTLVSPPFPIERPYLNFLIGGGGFSGKTCINLRVDGKIVRTATGPNVAPGGTERLYPRTWDVSALQGKTAQIEIVDAATGGWGHINVDNIVESDRRDAEDIVTDVLYGETYRPQFHFTGKSGWLNDPNGLVYFEGEYHLFYQHNPHGLTSNGIMYWGHAVSPDLVHWHELADAIEPDKLGPIWSGSAVADVNNTTGFGKDGKTPLVAIYTAAGGVSPESQGHLFTQCLTYSLDRGRTWTKYAGNPVLPHIVGGDRDPKLVWYAPTRHWVMALYLDREDYGLFTSPDLIHWTQTQTVTLPGSSECPDFFPMPVDGDTKNVKWVLTGANGHYLVGAFDGAKFTPQAAPQPEDEGANYYAVQTFSDIPAHDGRRIQIAWMNGGVYPQMPFNQQMSFPCELTLHQTPEGLRIRRWPVREIEKLYQHTENVENTTVAPGEASALHRTVGETADITLDIDLQSAVGFDMRVRGTTIHYNVADHTLNCLGRHATLKPIGNRITLRLLLDRTSLELFGNEGELSMTSCFLPPFGDKELSVSANEGALKVVAYRCHRLRSAWGSK